MNKYSLHLVTAALLLLVCACGDRERDPEAPAPDTAPVVVPDVAEPDAPAEPDVVPVEDGGDAGEGVADTPKDESGA